MVCSQSSGNKPAASWYATFWFWKETLCFSNEALQFAAKLPHNHKLENLSEWWFHRLRYVPVVLHKLLCKPLCWCHCDINMKTGNWSCNDIMFSYIEILHLVYCDILQYIVAKGQVRVRIAWKRSYFHSRQMMLSWIGFQINISQYNYCIMIFWYVDTVIGCIDIILWLWVLRSVNNYCLAPEYSECTVWPYVHVYIRGTYSLLCGCMSNWSRKLLTLTTWSSTTRFIGTLEVIMSLVYEYSHISINTKHVCAHSVYNHRSML